MPAETTSTAQPSRHERMLLKVGERRRAEIDDEIAALTAREEYFPALQYFTRVASDGLDPRKVAERVQKPVLALMCLQAPLELFHAFGLHPLKIFSGSQVAARLSAPSVSTLMCPMLRSALGALQLDAPAVPADAGVPIVADHAFSAWVLPTTCDWVVRFPEMMENCGYSRTKQLHYLELPHLKDGERGQARWLEEIYNLRDFLARLTGKKLSRKNLLRSIELYHEAWQALSQLTDLRRKGLVPGLWYALIVNAFFLCDVADWTQALKAALHGFKRQQGSRPRVMLAGSPIFFPNFKVLHLIEQAGLELVADDLCSGERVFPGGIFVKDTSEFGLMQALAERYHQGCLCPTFAENDRRLANILNPERQKQVAGVIFHVLKGCHPFDVSSFTLERRMREGPLKYIKLETDYTSEDSQTLLTRLEAFRGTLPAQAQI